MATLSERWRNSAVARETASIARSGSYRSINGVEVDLPPGTDEPFTVIGPPHFNAMQLCIWHGGHPGIVGVLCDIDAVSAAVLVTKAMRPGTGLATPSPGVLAEELPAVTSDAMTVAQRLVEVGAVVAPLPREQPGDIPDGVLTDSDSASAAAASGPVRGMGKFHRVALLGSIGFPAIGGWASTGALGCEEDLMRRSDLPELARWSTTLRKAFPLQEGAGLLAPSLRVFRGPAAPATTSTPVASASAVAGAAAVSPVGSDAVARLLPPDYGLMPEPVGFGFVGVTPPRSMAADRSIASDEATVKPSSRRTLLLAVHNQLSAAAGAGFTVLVVDALGLGGAGCSAPPIAVARLYRKILHTHFAGVFEAVVFASGGAGVELAAVLPDAAAAASSSPAVSFRAGSGEALHAVEDVAAAAAALATGDPSLWDAEASSLPEEAGPAAPAAAGASGAAGGAGTSKAAASRMPRLRRYHPSLRAWSLTDSDPTRGPPPPAAGDSDSAAARALALLPALLPSAIALHPGRAFLHVFAGTAVALPAPATSRLRHRLGMDATPAESSLVRRRRRATRVLERAERASVPGGAAAAALTDAGKVVVAAIGVGAGSPGPSSSSSRGRGWSSMSGRGSRQGSFGTADGSGTAAGSGEGVSIGLTGGYMPPTMSPSVNGSTTTTASLGRRSEADTTADTESLLLAGGMELSSTADDTSLMAGDGLAGPPPEIAGALAFAAPSTSVYATADDDII